MITFVSIFCLILPVVTNLRIAPPHFENTPVLVTVGICCFPAPSTLFATTGNSGGLALVIRTLTKPGDAVLMEEPSYFLAHKLFRDYGCTLRPVRQRMDGVGTIDVEAEP